MFWLARRRTRSRTKCCAVAFQRPRSPSRAPVLQGHRKVFSRRRGRPSEFSFFFGARFMQTRPALAQHRGGQAPLSEPPIDDGLYVETLFLSDTNSKLPACLRKIAPVENPSEEMLSWSSACKHEEVTKLIHFRKLSHQACHQLSRTARTRRSKYSLRPERSSTGTSCTFFHAD